jgi:hypothetical protein
MTDIIDFDKWKQDKKEQENAKYIWHSFPYFLDDTFETGEILVKREVFNEKTQKVETEYSFPTRETIETLYNTPAYCDGDLSWMSKTDLHIILSQYDDNDILG